METFSDKSKDFVQHISDNVREIHKKNLKIEDIFIIFTDTTVHIQIK